MISNSMTGLWLEDQKLDIRELPIPSPGPLEALIRLRLAGVCGTDLELIKGYYPYTGILGHEFVGEVIEAPSHPLLKGKRVVGEINSFCGECDTCLALRPTHCPKRTVLGIVNQSGVFSEYFTINANALHVVPSFIDDETAVFTEPLAAACQIFDQIWIRPNHKVLIIGAGRLGQLVAQVLSLTGCDLRVAAKYEHQIAILQKQGITASTSSSHLKDMDIIIEATGDGSGLKQAVEAVRPQGVIVLKSTYRGTLEVDFSSLVVNEVTLLGSRCGPFATALRLMKRSLVNPLPLVEARYSIRDGHTAFEHARRKGAMKVLLDP